jgi:hypothetical protein
MIFLGDAIFDAGLTEARLRKPRVFQRGRWYCPKCEEPTNNGRTQKCVECGTCLQKVCEYCDRAYARRTMKRHRTICGKRFFKHVSEEYPDIGLWADEFRDHTDFVEFGNEYESDLHAYKEYFGRDSLPPSTQMKSLLSDPSMDRPSS